MIEYRGHVLVTGAAGFIGFHLSCKLLEQGVSVVGVDCLSNYYDVDLKKARLGLLLKFKNFKFFEFDLVEHSDELEKVLLSHDVTIGYHLAAQAGVRHSIDAPTDYLTNNIIATFNIFEIGKRLRFKHLICASTSSVYGANTDMPFVEHQATDTQLSFYAATKKSCEAMAHSFANIHALPVTMCRFFTVYGPWGRPDMALFRFTKAMLRGEAIDVYNYGEMSRDFTYVSDVAESLCRLAEKAPDASGGENSALWQSPVACYRVLNIGNSKPTKLLDFIHAIERKLGVDAQLNMLGMQPGDVQATYADSSALYSLTGYRPETSVETGVGAFVDWYREYYQI